MSDSSAAPVDKPASVSIKGGMAAYVALHLPVGMNTVDARVQLGSLLDENPEAYRSAPCVLTPESAESLADELPGWLAWCRARELVPFALRGNDGATEALARAHGLACLPTSDRPRPVRTPAPRHRETRVITRQVRSGQQIYARDANLIILAAVSAGAEVMADHDIHVQGELRGRALAGLKNDDRAVISCQRLAAELVAINGRYTLPDTGANEGPVIIQCVDEQLVFASSADGGPLNATGVTGAHPEPE